MVSIAILQCPDADADGVPDAWDICPNTSRGSYVDSSGCPGSTLGNAPDQQRWNLLLLVCLLGAGLLTWHRRLCRTPPRP